MLSTQLASPRAILRQIAERARARRVAENWSRRTLASRAGVAESTIKRFELTGHIGVGALIQLALALDAADEFVHLFPAKAVASIDEMVAPKRQRGRR